jgi:hypothetical protein
MFQQAGITVSYFDYEGFREYPQLHPPFEHAVSVLDVLLHMGQAAPDYALRRGQRQPAAESDASGRSPQLLKS